MGGMKCPYCGTLENKVIDSRLSAGGEVTRRRRECEACTRRYTTYERVEQHVPMVAKADGRKQPFDRVKLLRGLRRATVKRPIDADRLEALVTRVEQVLAESGEREIPASVIGKHVLRELKALDTVAYVRFASVYRQFATLGEFVSELDALQDAKKSEPEA